MDRELKIGMPVDWEGDVAWLLKPLGDGYWQALDTSDGVIDNVHESRITPCEAPCPAPRGHVEARIQELEQALQMAIHRIEDMYEQDDGQAYVEAKKWLPRLKQVLNPGERDDERGR